MLITFQLIGLTCFGFSICFCCYGVYKSSNKHSNVGGILITAAAISMVACIFLLIPPQ
jgi:EamA domain-containing membrane protein RarD